MRLLAIASSRENKKYSGGKILLGVKSFNRTVRCLTINCPPTLLILPTSPWVSFVHRAFPAGSIWGLLPDLGVIRFTVRGGHVIRNFLKKGMGLSVPYTDGHSKFQTMYVFRLHVVHLKKRKNK